MMRFLQKPALLLISHGAVFLLFAPYAAALEADFRGRLSAWTEEARVQGVWRNASGVQYIPEFSLVQSVDDESFFEFEMSLNSYFANPLSDANADACTRCACGRAYGALNRPSSARCETPYGPTPGNRVTAGRRGRALGGAWRQ